jgi:predicted transcriptional regulator of viral defense system
MTSPPPKKGSSPLSKPRPPAIRPPLLAHYQKTGRIARIRRGIYRLVHFPSGEQEELVTAWLWTDSQGVLSHQTALALHGLSDVLPAKIHLAAPELASPTLGGWRAPTVRTISSSRISTGTP